MIGNYKKKFSRNGFSLMEVMIALAIFSIFISAFMTGHGSNLSDSAIIDEELILSHLCEKVIDETILTPPKYSESLTLTAETKTFEEAEYQDYQYTVRFKQLTIPDISQIQGNEEGEDDSYYGENNKSAEIEKKIFEALKKNLEKMIWQMEVTVTNKATGFNYTLTSWLTNEKAKLDIAI